MPSVIGSGAGQELGGSGDQGQAGDFSDSKLDSNVQLNLENLTKIDEKF